MKINFSHVGANDAHGSPICDDEWPTDPRKVVDLVTTRLRSFILHRGEREEVILLVRSTRLTDEFCSTALSIIGPFTASWPRFNGLRFEWPQDRTRVFQVPQVVE